jgi:tryptophan-rich sensory protein
MINMKSSLLIGKGISILNRTTWQGLLANVVVLVGLSALGNGIVNLFGWDSSQNPAPKPSFAPPDYVVGLVWVLLFAVLGAARWLLVGSGSTAAKPERRLILGLAIFCFLYPFYTLAFDSALAGLFGNLATILLAGYVTYRVRKHSAMAAAGVFLVVMWTCFATAIIIAQLQLE